MPTARETAIANAAITPKQASVDGTSATQQDIEAIIAADKYLAAKEAAQARRTGIRFTKVVGGQFES